MFRAHEVGHNLKLGHAGAVLHGSFGEYGDEQDPMGDSYSNFIAAAQYQLGVVGDDEIVTWDSAVRHLLYTYSAATPLRPPPDPPSASHSILAVSVSVLTL